MTEEVRLNDTQAQAYLERIGFQKTLQDITADRATLDELTFLHQCTIPFETIDMHHCTCPPDLAVEVVFNKMVTERRGGYCFELNYLYELLLAALGYNVRPIMCRAVRGRPGRMPINHRGIIVELDTGTHFVDVGFGGPLAAGSLALVEGIEQIVQGEFYIMKKVDDNWWAIERKSQGKKDLYGDEGPARIQVEIELCMAAVENVDFDSLNMYFARRGYLFSETNIVNLRTKDGFRGLRDTTLTIRRGGQKETIELPDEATFADAVEKYFGFRP